MINTATTTTPELIWVLSTVLALVFNIWGIANALTDKKDQVESGQNGALEQTANDEIRREWMRFAKLVIILVLGADVANREAATLEWRAYANAALSVVCLMDEIGDWIGRRRIRILLARMRKYIPAHTHIGIEAEVEAE